MTSDATPVLSVRDLSINAGALRLVHDVSFDVRAGERVGLIGASGSGKTLTCMAIAGLLPPELTPTGAVNLAGFEANMVAAPEKVLAKARGRVSGMVFQEPMTALNPTMRIDRQVAETIAIHRPELTTAQRSAEVLELLDAVDLPDPARIARSFPHQLSGGQRQRIVIAIALANSPSLLICDEPTTALDVSVQDTVLKLIDRRAAELDSAVLFISHDLAVVASLCDYLLVMYQGRLVEHGPVVEVLEAPTHPHTQQLLADADLTI